MTRRATIRTAHADPEAVAAAIAPDNTDEMETRVERVADESDDAPGDDAGPIRVVTEIERESTSGLQSTIDDTLVNLAVAEDVAIGARSGDGARARTESSATPPDGATDAADRHERDAPTAAERTDDASTDDRQRTDTNDTS